MKYTNRASTSRLAERSGNQERRLQTWESSFAASVFSIPCPVFLHPHIVATKKTLSHDSNFQVSCTETAPWRKVAVLLRKLGGKLQKQERSNLLFFPGANNTLTMTSGAHRKFPRRNGWQCAPDALCFRNTHSNRFSDLTGDSWAAGTDSPLAPPASEPAS